MFDVYNDVWIKNNLQIKKPHKELILLFQQVEFAAKPRKDDKTKQEK